MHVAAVSNQPAIVRQLHLAGCDINTTNHVSASVHPAHFLSALVTSSEGSLTCINDREIRDNECTLDVVKCMKRISLG